MRIRFSLILAVALGTVAAWSKAQSPDMPSVTVAHKNWEEPVKLNSNGYISQWLVLGPINYGEKYNAEEITKDHLKDEPKLMPKAGDRLKVDTVEGQPGQYKTVQKELTWKLAKIDANYFDLNKILDQTSSENMGAYAVTYLESPEEMKDISFSLSSNDNCKVILNGKKVHSFVGGRQLEEDSDVVPNLTLQKGTNVIIFKVWNDSNDWSGCLRLLTKDGKPVSNVVSRLPKSEPEKDVKAAK
jgi:hypothetical protein